MGVVRNLFESDIKYQINQRGYANYFIEWQKQIELRKELKGKSTDLYLKTFFLWKFFGFDLKYNMFLILQFLMTQISSAHKKACKSILYAWDVKTFIVSVIEEYPASIITSAKVTRMTSDV